MSPTHMIRRASRLLRSIWTAWAFAAFLPLPVLLVMARHDNGPIACLYLGVASAWLATEIVRLDGYPDSLGVWGAKSLAVVIAVTLNALLFIALGVSVGVHTNIPFPAMAIWSVVPALGLVPWLAIRLREPYASLVLGATVVLGIKLFACVIARIVYGPDFMDQGYVAGNWHTAKLMIVVLWSVTIAVSVGLAFADFCKYRNADSAAGKSLPQ